MRVSRLAAVAALVVLLTSSAALLHAEDKPKDLIVGKWEPAESPKGVTIVVEFTKDGKITIVGSAEGKEFKGTGTYKFTDDNTMETTIEFMGKKEVSKTKVLKVNKQELVTKDEPKKGQDESKIKEEKFKRVK
jgi:uncharacterized protein (TIGR03066 family)